MSIKSRSFQVSGRGVQALALGGLFGALAASSCCILPVVLFSLGVSGAWIGNFTRLAPYQPIFAAATAGLLGTGYWLVYRRSSRQACAGDQACARQLPNRVVMAVLVAATIIVIAAFGFDFVAPYLLS